MKIVLEPISNDKPVEMSVEQINDSFEISIYEHTEEQFCQTIRISHEEANELIKYLQEKMKF